MSRSTTILLILWLSAIGAVAIAWAQSVLDPKPVAAACAYNSVLPTATDGSFVMLQCDSTGKVMVH